MSRGNVPKSKLPRFVPPHTAHLLNNLAPARQIAVAPKLEVGRLHYRARERLRKKFFARDPLCAQCRREGRVREWDELDHIVPLAEGGTHDEANLQGLCGDCHDKKSATEHRERNRS